MLDWTCPSSYRGSRTKSSGLMLYLSWSSLKWKRLSEKNGISHGISHCICYIGIYHVIYQYVIYYVIYHICDIPCDIPYMWYTMKYTIMWYTMWYTIQWYITYYYGIYHLPRSLSKAICGGNIPWSSTVKSLSPISNTFSLAAGASPASRKCIIAVAWYHYI